MKNTNLLLISILIPIFLINSVTLGQTTIDGLWSGKINVRKYENLGKITLLSGTVKLNFETKKGEYEISSIGKKDFDFKVIENNKKYNLEIIVNIPELELDATNLRSLNYSEHKIELQGATRTAPPFVTIYMDISKENTNLK